MLIQKTSVCEDLSEMISRIAKSFLFATVFNLTLMTPGQSAPESSFLKDVPKNGCFGNDPELGMRLFELSPWFADLEKKLKEQTDYKELTSAFMKDRSTRDCVTCTFTVSRNGAVLNPKVHFGSDSAKIDQKFLALIKKLRLSPPTNDLPVQRGLQVTLGKVTAGGKIHVYLVREISTSSQS